jgi:hypothetical protein
MALINGAHAIIYSKRPEADLAFFRDVLSLPHVDVGGGWLIFGLPPAEVAVHPSKKNDSHELYLMCADIEALIAELARRGVRCSAVSAQGWGLVTRVALPGGGKLAVYQPRHARPEGPRETRSAKARATKRRPAKIASKRPSRVKR